MRKAICAAAALWGGLTAPSLAAADALTFSLAQYSADNLFQTSVPVSDQVSQASASWSKGLGAFSLYADASYDGVWRNTGLSDTQVAWGADAVLSLGKASVLYFGLETGLALYRSDFADFNHNALKGRISFKTYLSPTSILKADVVTEYKSFRLSLFDFLSQNASLSLDKYFQTKTTLKAEAAWGYKYFFHPTLTDKSASGWSGDIVAFETTALSPEDGSPRDPKGRPDDPGGSQSGRPDSPGGQGGSDGSSESGSGSGPGNPGTGGKGYGVSRSLFYYSGAESGGQGLQVASISGLLAQGLGTSVGVRLSGTRQWCLSGKNPYASIEEYTLVENPTYDRFSWEGYQLNGLLSASLPWDIDLKIGYTWSVKEFPGVQSLDLEGTPRGSIRRDDRRQWELRVDKALAGINLFVALASIRNASNDPLFTWRGAQIFGGLTWSFDIGRKKP